MEKSRVLYTFVRAESESAAQGRGNFEIPRASKAGCIYRRGISCSIIAGPYRVWAAACSAHVAAACREDEF